MALKLGIQTYQILTSDDEVCIPSLSSILLAVCGTVFAVAAPCYGTVAMALAGGRLKIGS